MKNKFLAGLTATLMVLIVAGMANAITINLNSLTSNPIVLSLEAGSYTVTPIEDQYISWNAWGDTINGHGWINNYSLASSEFSAYLVTDGIRYSTAQLALDNALSTSFTLLNDTEVSFYIADSNYRDNVGGMSLAVEPTAPVPEPSTILLLGAGLVGLGFYRTNRKKA